MVCGLQGKRYLNMMIFVAIFLCVVAAADAPAGEDLKVGGVGSPLGVMKLVGRSFEKAHPGIKIRVLPSLGSAGAMKALSRNAIDVGIVSRELTDDERKLGLASVPFARSPFVFVTHRNVPVSNISLNEIIKIYEGKTMVWPDGKRLRIVLRPSSDTDTLIARRISSGLAEALASAAARPGILTALTDQDLVDTVEATPGAFGFSTLTLASAEKRRLNVLSYNNVKPTVKNLSDGSYTLWKPFYAVVQKDGPPLAHAFFKFMLSREAKRIMEDNGNMVTDQ
jgi:phosphate transport system substrate-binding protein